LRIVVIDDDPDLLLLCRVNLHLEGFEVHEASGGTEGLELIAACDPDVVILDVMMPKLDGFDVLRAIRANPHTSELPVVILSARVGKSDQAQGYRSGADAYVTKPFSPRQLVETLTRIVAAQPANVATERE
jgi:two-component system alkaline phosphatase synthesis response regulator PhoP